MLITDPTCAALASATVYFDGPTVNGSGHAVHEANQGYSHVPKLAVHTSTLLCTEAALFNVQLAWAQMYSRFDVNPLKFFCVYYAK